MHRLMARAAIHFDVELAAPELLMRALGGDVERCQRRGQRRILRARERAMITTYLDKALRLWTRRRRRRVVAIALLPAQLT